MLLESIQTLGNEVGAMMNYGEQAGSVGAARNRDEIKLSQIDLGLSQEDIERTLGSAREILERHLIGDDLLGDGRTVRQVFYELTDVAIQALRETRERSTR